MQAAEDQARSLIEARMASIRRLVNADATAAELRDDLAAATKEHKAAWRAALKDGWTPEQLRKTGLSDPTGSGKRTRAPRKRPSPTTTPQPAPAPEPSNPDA